MKYILFTILGIIIIGLVLIEIFKIPIVNHLNEKTQNEYIEKFRDSFNIITFRYDSIIELKEKTIDSLKNIKQTTITIYEKAESDFSDRNIISDDSILRYISKKIQN